MEFSQQTVLFIIVIVGQIVGLVIAIRKPNEDLAKKQLADSKDQLAIDKEADKKAEVLARELQWAKEATEKRFIEFGVRLDKAFELAANHVNTVDVKVDHLVASVNNLALKVKELQTIIQERIPRK